MSKEKISITRVIDWILCHEVQGFDGKLHNYKVELHFLNDNLENYQIIPDKVRINKKISAGNLTPNLMGRPHALDKGTR